MRIDNRTDDPVPVIGVAGSAALGSVTVTNVVPGVTATDLGKAEDAAHASGSVGVMSLGVRTDTLAAFGADGDYTPTAHDQYGRAEVRSGGVTLQPQITFTLDTSIYAAGDVLADTQELTAALRPPGSGVLHSIRILDEDDNAAAAMTVYIFKSNVSLGTENAAISITDANARELIGIIAIAAADWVDLINSKAAFKGNLGIPVVVASGTSLWVALSTAGTPTQTASGITARFGILCD